MGVAAVTRDFVVVRDCWRWALGDESGVIVHSESAFPTKEEAVADLEASQARRDNPDVEITVRERG